MEVIKILIFDDDQKVVDDFYATIKSLNATGLGKTIVGSSCTKKHISVIKKHIKSDLNGIIIDMKWHNNEKYGERIVNEAKRHMIPIIIYSGNPYEIDENDFFKFFSKSNKLGNLLEHIINIYNTNIFNIFSNEGLLIEEIHGIFWKHVSGDILSWNGLSQELKSKRLMRYVVSRLSNKFLIGDESEASDSLSSSEFYINPIIKDKIHPGLVILEKKSNKRYVILNASCDMERTIPENIVLCESSDDFRDDYIQMYNNATTSDKRRSIKDKFERIVKNGNPQYQYLPPYKGKIKESFFNFQKVINVSKNDILEMNEFEKLYTINPEVYKDIQYRFTHYFARQGQPELDSEERNDLSKLV